MDMAHYQQLGRRSLKESLENLENDVQHANALATAIPQAKGGARLQMKLVYNCLGPFFLFLLEWIDCPSIEFFPGYLNIGHVVFYKVYGEGRRRIAKYGRISTIKEFYAIILPSLEQLHIADTGDNEGNNRIQTSFGRKELGRDSENINADSERDEECGICLVPCTKIVLPECCHKMCIQCYYNWSIRSNSCPFCHGNLGRVDSSDLWVLIFENDVVDPETILSEDSKRLYQYIKNLPKESPDALFLTYDEYLTCVSQKNGV